MKAFLNNCRKSKTIIFGTLLSILGFVQASSGALTPYMSPEHFGLFSMVVGVVVIVLRAVTNGSLADKTPTGDTAPSESSDPEPDGLDSK